MATIKDIVITITRHTTAVVTKSLSADLNPKTIVADIDRNIGVTANATYAQKVLPEIDSRIIADIDRNIGTSTGDPLLKVNLQIPGVRSFGNIFGISRTLTTIIANLTDSAIFTVDKRPIETVTLLENLTFAFSKVLSDEASLTDSLNTAFSKVLSTETLNLFDSPQFIVDKRPQNEVVVNEVVALTTEKHLAIEELSIIDWITYEIGLGCELSSQLAFTDNITSLLFEKVLIETIQITDWSTRAKEGYIEGTPSMDISTLEDTLSMLVTKLLDTEVVVVEETLNFLLDKYIYEDSFIINDVPYLAVDKQLSDIADLIDNLAIVVEKTLATDEFQLTDTTDFEMNFSRDYSELIELLDNFSFEYGMRIIDQEDISIEDNFAFNLDYKLSDLTAFTDSLTYVKDMISQSDDLFTVNDTTNFSTNKALSEEVAFLENLTFQVELALSDYVYITDNFNYEKTGSGTNYNQPEDDLGSLQDVFTFSFDKSAIENIALNESGKAHIQNYVESDYLASDYVGTNYTF